jgi:hypothetical protein
MYLLSVKSRPASGAKGRWFESSRPDHLKSPITFNFSLLTPNENRTALATFQDTLRHSKMASFVEDLWSLFIAHQLCDGGRVLLVKVQVRRLRDL